MSAAADRRCDRDVREPRAPSQGGRFERDLELGVLYLVAPQARRRHERRSIACRRRIRDYPMALFKRAQVSVLLNEPDRAARIDAARAARNDRYHASSSSNERLFKR